MKPQELMDEPALFRKSTAPQWDESNMQIVTWGKIERMFTPTQVLWVLGLVILLLSGAHGQSPTAGEYQVKAAFLYNFAKFVEWPPSSFSGASAPYKICVLGQDPFGQDLHDITADKSLNGRRFEVNHITDLQQARGCLILFICSSELSQMKQILGSLRGSGILTVGDTKGFAEMGGVINFVLENDRVQFEVNRKAAELAGLKISSKLLNVAKVVIG